MTIRDAIERIDTLVHNTYSMDDKIAWLSRLDSYIKQSVIDKHSGDPVEFNGYNFSTPMTTTLLAPEPHDQMYLYWLEAQIAYYNGEYDKYNNAIEMYSASFAKYSAWYTDKYKPNRSTRFLF